MQVRAEASVFRAALAARGFVPASSTRMRAPAGLSGREAQRLKQAAWQEALRSAAYSAVVLRPCGCCHEHVFTFSPERAAELRAKAEQQAWYGAAMRAM